MSNADHWIEVYRTKPTDKVSWYQREPTVSLALIERLGLGWDQVIAVGDSENDRGMLSQAGCAVVISPMTLEALAAARPGQIRRPAADTAGALAAVREILSTQNNG